MAIQPFLVHSIVLTYFNFLSFLTHPKVFLYFFNHSSTPSRYVSLSFHSSASWLFVRQFLSGVRVTKLKGEFQWPGLSRGLEETQST